MQTSNSRAGKKTQKKIPTSPLIPPPVNSCPRCSTSLLIDDEFGEDTDRIVLDHVNPIMAVADWHGDNPKTPP
jgi:hypothetical protein